MIRSHVLSTGNSPNASSRSAPALCRGDMAMAVAFGCSHCVSPVAAFVKYSAFEVGSRARVHPFGRSSFLRLLPASECERECARFL